MLVLIEQYESIQNKMPKFIFIHPVTTLYLLEITIGFVYKLSELFCIMYV